MLALYLCGSERCYYPLYYTYWQIDFRSAEVRKMKVFWKYNTITIITIIVLICTKTKMAATLASAPVLCTENEDPQKQVTPSRSGNVIWSQSQS